MRTLSRHPLIGGVLVAALLSAVPGRSLACNEHGESHHDDARAFATQRLEWRSEHAPRGANPASWLHVRLLGLNDFHGQLAPRVVAGRPAGGIGVLASYLRAEAAGLEDATFIVHAGDHVGASPPSSALLQDEPAISFLNLLSNDACDGPEGCNPRCNVVGAPGNHEFDEGLVELKRLLEGGDHPNGPFLDDRWTGALYPTVCANVVHDATGAPVFPPYVIRIVRGMRIAFIGAVTRTTPTIVTPTGVAGLRFLDEADAINSYLPELRAQHVEAIVVTIHEGGSQGSYLGGTNPALPPVSGAIVGIVARLGGAVDVVVSGHAHQFTNALLPNAAGRPVLVTQAFSASTAFAEIDLWIDPATKDVVAKSASVVTTWGDAGPGLTPSADALALRAAADAAVAPLVNEVIANAATAITRVQSPAGENALGNLIADAQRAATDSEISFMNPGGIRADLDAGLVTWGELFTIQPFGNSLVTMDLTGAQVLEALEKQWLGQPFPRILKPAGIAWTWDASRPVGSRIVAAQVGGVPLSPASTYRVTVNSFLAAGGDNFTVFAAGTNRVGGDIDLDALVDHVRALPQPFTAVIEGRITRLN